MSCDHGFSRILTWRGVGYALGLLTVTAVLWRILAETSLPPFPESSTEARPGTDAASLLVAPSPLPGNGSPEVGQILARVEATSDPNPVPQAPSQSRLIQTMLSGSVLRAGEPVSGAEVRVRHGGLSEGIGGDLVRTGVAGTYLFPKLSPGPQTVTVVESDQLLAAEEIELAYGDRRVLDVEVPAVTRFRGRLHAPGGCPFTDLRIQFVPEWISRNDRPPNDLFSWAVDRNAVQVAPDGSFEFPAVVAQAGTPDSCFPARLAWVETPSATVPR